MKKYDKFDRNKEKKSSPYQTIKFESTMRDLDNIMSSRNQKLSEDINIDS